MRTFISNGVIVERMCQKARIFPKVKLYAYYLLRGEKMQQAVDVMLNWINTLKTIRAQILEYNQKIAYKKIEMDGRIISSLEPNDEEMVTLSEIALCYRSVVNEIFSFLSIYPKLKMRFSYIEESVMSYIFFNRSNGDMPEDIWREQFVVEFNSIMGRMITLMEEIIEVRTNERFRCFKTAAFCNVSIKQSKSDAFVIMPFDPKFDDIYNIGIKETLSQIGISCSRADEITHSRDIMCRAVCKPIQEALFIIADMTLTNANVFFELGLSYGFEKEIILIAQNVDDIPFDLRTMNSVIYNNEISKLRKEILQKAKWYIK